MGVTQQAISKRLKDMGMIQKQGNCVPYKLKPWDIEWRFFALNSGFKDRIRRGFHIALWPVTKNGSTMIIPSADKKHDKVILQHDNAQPHVARPVKTYLETLKLGPYPTHRTLQTLLLPITICFDQWHTA